MHKSLYSQLLAIDSFLSQATKSQYFIENKYFVSSVSFGTSDSTRTSKDQDRLAREFRVSRAFLPAVDKILPLDFDALSQLCRTDQRVLLFEGPRESKPFESLILAHSRIGITNLFLGRPLEPKKESQSFFFSRACSAFWRAVEPDKEAIEASRKK
mmetsp:Transcript_19264/g.47974  ORF Transcript_19264/g.47974 Transcript_19264/m.47974 type:complete len:156 (-) Transcript_19264:1497-1964(-)